MLRAVGVFMSGFLGVDGQIPENEWQQSRLYRGVKWSINVDDHPARGRRQEKRRGICPDECIQMIMYVQK
jgi:hypothetical protein